MEERMTVFYMKSSGNVKHLITGDQNFSIFGSEAEDYKIIFGRILVPYNDFVFRNSLNYKVIDGKLKLSEA